MKQKVICESLNKSKSHKDNLATKGRNKNVRQKRRFYEQKYEQKYKKHSKKIKVQHDEFLMKNNENLKKLKSKIKFFIQIMKKMRGKGQMIECGFNESHKIIRDSYETYQIMRELIQYKKESKPIDVRYVNLTQKYAIILARLHKNSQGQIKKLLSQLFESTVQHHKPKLRKRPKKIKIKEQRTEKNISENEYFTFDLGPELRNNRYIERAYTSTIVEKDDSKILKQPPDLIPVNKSKNETTFNDEIRFFTFRDTNNHTLPSINTEYSTKDANLITASTNDNLLIAPKISQNDQSQSIFDKIGNKLGDTF